MYGIDKYMKEILAAIIGFNWDSGNRDKNQVKHAVSWQECEEIFFNQPLLIQIDHRHSNTESRWYALGKTHAKRLLFLSFTIRENHIRVISARDQHKKERSIYQSL